MALRVGYKMLVVPRAKHELAETYEWLTMKRYCVVIDHFFGICASVGERKWKELERHGLASRCGRSGKKELLIAVHPKMMDDFMFDDDAPFQ